MASNESAEPKQDFETLAREKQTGVLREFWLFLKYNKKWWLLPILVVLFLLAALIFLGGTGAAPFIYTLF